MKYFLSVLLILCMIFSLSSSVSANITGSSSHSGNTNSLGSHLQNENARKNIYDTGITGPGLDRLRFIAINGEDHILRYNFMTTVYNAKEYTIFNLEDPLGLQESSGVFPGHLDMSMIYSVLAIGIKLSTRAISEYVGVNATNNEYLAAIQVAIWRIVSLTSQKYKLDPTSVTNQNVNEIAKWLISTAEASLAQKPPDIPTARYFLPRPELRVNHLKAEGVVVGQFNFYGPYTLESIDLRAIVKTERNNEFTIVNDVEGLVLHEIRINQPFYVRFDRVFSSDLDIKFIAETNVPMYMTYSNHILMIDNWEECFTNLTIGNSIAAGRITYTKTDNITNATIPGVVLEIKDAYGAIVTSMTTDHSGVATSPLLRIGEYTVQEKNTSPGYMLEPDIVKASIQGSGQIVRLTSKGRPNIGFVTFYLKDIDTNGPVGGSVFDVIDTSGTVVTKIGFNDTGRCANIQLRDGDYLLREIKTDPNYNLLVTTIPFKSVLGEVSEVDIIKTPSFNKVHFTVLDNHSVAVPNPILELYRDDGFYITELTGDSDGKLSIGLPLGDYYVKQKSNGNFYTGEQKAFSVNRASLDTDVFLGVINFESMVYGYVYDTSLDPVPGIGLVIVDEEGFEYDTAVTNFEGYFEFFGVPNSSVLFVHVHRASLEFSGHLENNRVITVLDRTEKNLILWTMDEFNANLEEEDQLIRYPFYLLKTTVTSSSSDNSLDFLRGEYGLPFEESSDTASTDDIAEIDVMGIESDESMDDIDFFPLDSISLDGEDLEIGGSIPGTISEDVITEDSPLDSLILEDEFSDLTEELELESEIEVESSGISSFLTSSDIVPGVSNYLVIIVAILLILVIISLRKKKKKVNNAVNMPREFNRQPTSTSSPMQSPTPAPVQTPNLPFNFTPVKDDEGEEKADEEEEEEADEEEDDDDNDEDYF